MTTISGSAADANTAYASNGITGLGNEIASISDVSITASVLNTLDGNTTGEVNGTNLTNITGATADVNTVYASSGITNLGNETVTITDTSVAAAVLSTLDGNTTGTVNANTLNTITGTAAEVLVAYASSGISNLGTESVTLSGTVSVADLTTIQAKSGNNLAHTTNSDGTYTITGSTSGYYVTGGTIIEGDVATLLTLKGYTDCNVNITDSSVSAVDIFALENLVGPNVSLSNVNTITSTVAAFSALTTLYSASCDDVTNKGSFSSLPPNIHA